VFTVTVEGLEFTAAHFHDGAVGVNGGVVRAITGDFVGNTASGTWTRTGVPSLTAKLIANLLAGNIYVNIHTAANGGGEIRGQVNLSTSFVVAQAEMGVCYATTGSLGGTASSLLTIDLATGTGTLVGPTGITGVIEGTPFPGVPGLAIKSTGEIFGTNTASNTGLYKIDATSGQGSLVATTGLARVDGIAFDGNDQLWVVGQAVFPLANLYMVDEVTGATTLVGPTGFAMRGLAFDPITGVLWGSDGGGGIGQQPADGIYTIDTNTGAATLVGKTGLWGFHTRPSF